MSQSCHVHLFCDASQYIQHCMDLQLAVDPYKRFIYLFIYLYHSAQGLAQPNIAKAIN